MYTRKFVLSCSMFGVAFTSMCISIAQMTLLMRASRHNQSSTLPFEIRQAHSRAHIDYTSTNITNMTPAASHNTVIYAIVTASTVRNRINTGNDRQKLVQASLKAWPALRRFNASYQLDHSCVSILRQTHITIGPNYYSEERGVGWIHAGKVGHWCSFLRYINYCNASNAAVSPKPSGASPGFKMNSERMKFE